MRRIIEFIRNLLRKIFGKGKKTKEKGLKRVKKPVQRMPTKKGKKTEKKQKLQPKIEGKRMIALAKKEKTVKKTKGFKKGKIEKKKLTKRKRKRVLSRAGRVRKIRKGVQSKIEEKRIIQRKKTGSRKPREKVIIENDELKAQIEEIIAQTRQRINKEDIERNALNETNRLLMKIYEKLPAQRVQQQPIIERRFEEELEMINAQIDEIERLMKDTTIAFYKRRIAATEFERRVFELQKNLAKLNAKKKILSQKLTTEQKKIKVFGEGVLRTKKARKQVIKNAEAAKGKEKIVSKEKIPRQEYNEMISHIESNLSELIQKYNIPRKEIEREVNKIGLEEVLEDMHKLISIIETKYAKKEREPEILPKTYTMKKEEIGSKVKAVEKEIKEQELSTELDKLLKMVKERKEVKEKTAAKELGISNKELMEYAKILETQGLVSVEYAAIGGAKIKYRVK